MGAEVGAGGECERKGADMRAFERVRVPTGRRQRERKRELERDIIKAETKRQKRTETDEKDRIEDKRNA